MKSGTALLFCALALLAGGCTVQPAVPVAKLHVPPPLVVSPMPVVVAPAFHPLHPGRGRGHHKHHFH